LLRGGGEKVNSSDRRWLARWRAKENGIGNNAGRSPTLTEQTESDESESGYDQTLLAIIGILDEIKGQSNVAGWIRAGGIWAAAGGGVDGVDVSMGNDGVVVTPAAAIASSMDLDPADLNMNPNSLETTAGEGEGAEGEDKKMWFDHEPTFGYWVGRGREAVDELGVEVVHGVVGPNE